MRTVVLLGIALVLTVVAASPDSKFNGRWDLTVPDEPRARAWWLEVTGAGTPAISGRFIGAPGGGLDVIPKISVKEGELEFIFERPYGTGSVANKGIYRVRMVDGKLQGTFEVEGMPERKLSFTGTRAPALKEKDNGSWKPGTPVELFNGKDLSGFHSRLPGRGIGWRVTGGVLNNGTPPVPDLITDAKFWNFALHVEYRIGKGSNSGVGLRGRYEVQIVDDYGKDPTVHGNGALYSRIVPSTKASRAPGEWQSLDIRLIGREVTVVLNDVKIIDRREIEGLTAIATDPNEGTPGPIVLQGDHGPVEFRKITLTPLSK